MALNLSVPEHDQLSPRIAVIGVGGAGGNAVNNMIAADLQGVEFIATNTDAQALSHSLASRKIQLGIKTTEGLGAGTRPEIGRAAAEETADSLSDALCDTHMLFITAGMGGGTGTGAAPVVARLARELGILTVGVVTKPFQFEGVKRMKMAEMGIEAIQQHVDTLIVIPNQNLFRVANEKTTCADAFAMADDVLYSGVRGITDLMVVPGLINLDFADVRTVMSEMGKAIMGTGEGQGEDREIVAAETAISNPLLDEVSLQDARGILINITGGSDMTLFEIDKVANRISEEVGGDAEIVFGSAIDPDLDGKIRVSVVATGIDPVPAQSARPSLRSVPSGQSSAPEAATSPEAAREEAAPKIDDRGDEALPGRLSSGAAVARTLADDPPISQPAAERADAIPAAAGALPLAELAPERVLVSQPQAITVTPPTRGGIPQAPDGDRAAVKADDTPDLFKADVRPVVETKPSRLFGGLFRKGSGDSRKEARKAVAAEAVEMAAKAQPSVAAERTPVPEQTRLEGVDSGDRIRTSQADDDLLEIPAFLRRQAN